MALSDCPNCWNTPCTCGAEYRGWGIQELEEFVDTLQMVLRDKKEALGFRKDEKQDPTLAAKAWPLKTELQIHAEAENRPIEVELKARPPKSKPSNAELKAKAEVENQVIGLGSLHANEGEGVSVDDSANLIKLWSPEIDKVYRALLASKLKEILKEGEAITAEEAVRVVIDKHYQDEVVSEFIKEAEPVVKKIAEREQAEALQRATEAVKLIRIDFDNMENRDPYSEEEVGIFVGDLHLTAHGKASQFMRTMEKVRPYAGYDGQVYPQFKLKTVKLNQGKKETV